MDGNVVILEQTLVLELKNSFTKVGYDRLRVDFFRPKSTDYFLDSHTKLNFLMLIRFSQKVLVLTERGMIDYKK